MLFGHQDKFELFRRLVEKDNLSHAYLFYGPSGIGKFKFAEHLALSLEDGKTPLIDSRVFSPDEKGKIGVETSREIKAFLSGSPLRSPRRLAIIRDAETLTDQAQSALLKIVEEPPAKAMLIFIAADAQSLFAPLLSRLASIYFRSFSKSEIKDFLAEKHKISKSRIEEIAGQSFGRTGRAAALALKESKDDEITRLYLESAVKNSKVLSELLLRETALRRYNLNQGLQQKAIEYLLQK